MVSGAFDGVHWVTQDGGLEVDYLPGKPFMVRVTVNESFAADVPRVWIKDYPGATERWLGRVDVPAPEELFAGSSDDRLTYVDVKSSDLMALCRYYSHATDIQRLSIEYHVEGLAERDELSPEARECFEEVIGEQGKSSLEE